MKQGANYLDRNNIEKMVAEGKSVEEIAARLNINPKIIGVFVKEMTAEAKKEEKPPKAPPKAPKAPKTPKQPPKTEPAEASLVE